MITKQANRISAALMSWWRHWFGVSQTKDLFKRKKVLLSCQASFDLAIASVTQSDAINAGIGKAFKERVRLLTSLGIMY